MLDLIGLCMACLIFRESGKGGCPEDADRISGAGVDCSELAECRDDCDVVRGLSKASQLHRKARKD